MFYRPQDGHGLPHNPLNAIVAPRPIGWVSTRGRQGDNLAPYSFFNLTAYVPPQIMFASLIAKKARWVENEAWQKSPRQAFLQLTAAVQPSDGSAGPFTSVDWGRELPPVQLRFANSRG